MEVRKAKVKDGCEDTGRRALEQARRQVNGMVGSRNNGKKKELQKCRDRVIRRKMLRFISRLVRRRNVKAGVRDKVLI